MKILVIALALVACSKETEKVYFDPPRSGDPIGKMESMSCKVWRRDGVYGQQCTSQPKPVPTRDASVLVCEPCPEGEVLPEIPSGELWPMEQESGATCKFVCEHCGKRFRYYQCGDLYYEVHMRYVSPM